MKLHNCRFKKSAQKNPDGSSNTIVREDNIIREYSSNTGNKIRETSHPSNAAAKMEMASA